MMKRLAIGAIAAVLVATMVSLPRAHAELGPDADTLNPQGILKPDPFRDVPPDHWAYQAVEYLRRQGIAEGYPDRTYKGRRMLTRYEFANFLYRLLQGLIPRLEEVERAVREVGPADGISEAELERRLAELRAQLTTPEQVREIVREMLAELPDPVAPPPAVTRAEFEALQRLVNEFRDELARMGVDVDALRREMATMRGRVDAIEEQLRRLPRIVGNFNVIGKTSWQSPQNVVAGTQVLRPAFDQDARPLKESTQVLRGGRVPETEQLGAGVLGYYDLDLGIVARPLENVLVGAVLNAGNYVSSYRLVPEHNYQETGPDEVRPYKVFLNVPFRFLGANEVTVGRQGTQLTPYTFWAVDPDIYTFIPREDSGEVVFWGVNTTFRFGNARLRGFAGTGPEDGRLQPLNVYPIPMTFGLAPTFANTNTFGGGVGTGLPIQQIGNFAGLRLSFGEPDVPPFRAAALPVGTAEQRGLTPDAPRPVRAVTPDEGVFEPLPWEEEEAAAAEGITFGPFRNFVVGLNWLIAAGRRTNVVEDARANVYGADARFNLGPLRIQGEIAHGISDTGGVARRRALDNTAFDVRGFWNIGLLGVPFELGGGYRRIELGYLVPGYWGLIGSWKNPRGIQGPLAEVRIPLGWNIAPFLRNIVLRGSAEFYEGAQNLATVGLAPGQTDPNERNLRIDRYLAGLQFALTSRNTVSLGFEQVFRNYVQERATDAPLTLPTMGFGGAPLVGNRIKNTETYVNFGVGHSFTPDIALQLFYQMVDYGRYREDDTATAGNGPHNFRGYIATAQVGVRF